MSRPLRLEFKGALYHVTSRGDRREPIFDDDVDRQAWLEVFEQSIERFAVTASPVFTRMEDTQDEDILVSDLEANLVVSHQNLADLARLELGKPRAEPRVDGNSFSRRR